MLEAQLEDELEEQSHLDVTLTNTTLLAIFFGMVIVCGIFFGFGYSLGGHRNASQAPVKEFSSPRPMTETAALTHTAALPPKTVEPAVAKPSAGMVTSASSTGEGDAAITTTTSAKTPAASVAANNAITGGTKTKPVASITPVAATIADPATTATPSGKTYMVQVAALAQPGDADILCNALRRKGYRVILATSKQDKLLHVQIGPFASMDDAKAMRDRLSSDGYSPILK
jgi:DedD protein